MATLNITEYEKLALDGNDAVVPVPLERAVAKQSVTFTTSTASSAFNGRTRFVRLLADLTCYVDFNTAPSATTSSTKLIANQEYWFGVPDGADFKVAAYDGSS